MAVSIFHLKFLQIIHGQLKSQNSLTTLLCRAQIMFAKQLEWLFLRLEDQY